MILYGPSQSWYDMMTHPQTLQEAQRWVLKQNNGRRRELGHAP